MCCWLLTCLKCIKNIFLQSIEINGNFDRTSVVDFLWEFIFSPQPYNLNTNNQILSNSTTIKTKSSFVSLQLDATFVNWETEKKKKIHPYHSQVPSGSLNLQVP